MKVRLFINSDTCLNFNSRTKAIIHAEKSGIVNYLILTEYEKHPDLNTNFNFSVFNPFLTKNTVEYFVKESDVIKYIGSFL